MKALLFWAILSVSAFGAPPIGIVTASGHFTLQGSEVWSNATLFEGATVETGAASSQLALRSGVKIQLAAGSRARVFADRLTLDRGMGQVTGPAPFEIDTALFRIQGSGVRVALGQTVDVAAVNGVAKVSGVSGRVLAAIQPGRNMSFAPQDAQSGVVKKTGCMLYKDGHFILQDDTTQEVLELNNPDLAPNLGNRVEITGNVSNLKPTVSIAGSRINVTSVSPKSQGGCLVAASTLEARTEMPPGAGGAVPPSSPPPLPAATHTGMSTGTKVAIWGGVIGGGAAGAIIALESGKKSVSP